MLSEYINKAIETANYKILENGQWFAEINNFEGVWATGNSVEETRHELIEVLEEWILLKIRDNDKLPVLENIDLNITENAIL